MCSQSVPNSSTSRTCQGLPAFGYRLIASLNADCPKAMCILQDSVYVYDDIPDFVNGPRDAENVSNAVLLGAFCGMNPGNDLVVKAHTGTIVIYFEADLTRKL